MIKEQLQQFLAEAQELINIESPTSNPEGIALVADFFEKKAKSMNLEVERVELDPSVGPCLVISNNLKAESFDVMLSAHMDTVFPIGHIKESPFRIEGDLVKGPGIIDDKGCGLMGLYALQDLDLSTFNFVFTLNSQEEQGSILTGSLLKKYAQQSKSALILEAARENGELVVSRKGIARYYVTFTGKAAHSGNEPEKGANAVFEAANFLTYFSHINDQKAGHTFNAIIKEGGSALNIIPDKVVVALEMRYLQDSSLEFFKQQYEKAISNKQIEGVSITLEQYYHSAPMFNELASKELKEIVDNSAKEIGLDIAWVIAGGGSDGNLTSSTGCPTLDGFGMIGGNMHHKEEYGRIESIIPRVNLLATSIKNIATYFKNKK